MKAFVLTLSIDIPSGTQAARKTQTLKDWLTYQLEMWERDEPHVMNGVAWKMAIGGKKKC